MKRTLLAFLFSIFYLTIYANSPQLPLLQAFDGRYNQNKDVSLYEIKQPGNFYYSIEVKDNPEITAQLNLWIKETEKNASSIYHSSENGKDVDIIFIEEGDISIGIRRWNANSSISIFIHSSDPIP